MFHNVQRPYSKSLGVGDRVVVTVGACRGLSAVVLAHDSGRFTLQPDGWPRGVLLQIDARFVQRKVTATRREKSPQE